MQGIPTRLSNNMDITYTKQGNFMVLANDSLGKALIKDQDYEPHFFQVISKIVKPGDVVIDCGANLGYHTVTLGKLVGNFGKVISFEPQRLIYQQMCGNVFLNELRNVVALNNAVGDSEKEIQMERIDYSGVDINIGCTKLGDGGDRARMLTLDGVVESLGLANYNISFIKADIQGCEVMMLDGAAKLIARCRPHMFVEVEGWLRSFGQTEDTLKKKLIDMGYVLVQIQNDWPTDHICVPVEKESTIPDIIKDLIWPTRIYK